MTARRIVGIVLVALVLAAVAIWALERRSVAADDTDCDPRNDLCAQGCP
jgi:hypothetical protein